MKPNLDTLKREIPDYLQTKGLALFQGFVNELHEQKLVFWDVEKETDYRAFVEGLTAAVAQLVARHAAPDDPRSRAHRLTITLNPTLQARSERKDS